MGPFETAPLTAQLYRRAATRVRRWRQQQNDMTQTAFAELAGVSVGALQTFETGARKTRAKTIAKIAGAIGVSIAELVRDLDAPPIGDPRAKDLRDADFRLAQLYHHADAEPKHAIQRLLSADVPDDRRNRIASIVEILLDLDDAEFIELEGLIHGSRRPVSPAAAPSSVARPTAEPTPPRKTSKG